MRRVSTQFGAGCGVGVRVLWGRFFLVVRIVVSVCLLSGYPPPYTQGKEEVAFGVFDGVFSLDKNRHDAIYYDIVFWGP